MKNIASILCVVVLLGFASRAAAQGPIIESEVPRILTVSPTREWEEIPESDISEDELRIFSRFQHSDPPDEVFVLSQCNCLGTVVFFMEIIVRGERAELRYSNSIGEDRYFYRDLKPKQLARLRQFMADNRVDTWLGYSNARWAGGTTHRFYRFTKDGARSISIKLPPIRGSEESEQDIRDGTLSPDAPAFKYGDLLTLFLELVDPDTIKMRYLLSRRIPGLEMVFAHPHRNVLGAWADVRDVRVLVSNGGGMMGQRWKGIENGRLGRDAVPPEGIAFLKPGGSFSGSYPGMGLLEPDAVEAKDEGGEPNFTRSVRTSDGRWTVGFAREGGLVRYDRRDKKTFDVEMPLLTHFNEIAYMPSCRKVMLRERRTNLGMEGVGTNPSSLRGPACGVLDPETGKMTKRHLLFNPWLDRDDRLSGEPLREPFLQPTGRANMVWVYQGGMLGRYDTKKFEFVESFWVPTEVISNGKRHQSLQVDSGAVWVDEVGKKVYIIDRGCLVSLPLPDKLHRHKAGSRETEGYGGVRGQGTGSTLDT